jgi:hypothetical protein
MLRTQFLLKEGRSRDAAICAERIETLARDHRFSSDDVIRRTLWANCWCTRIFTRRVTFTIRTSPRA